MTDTPARKSRPWLAALALVAGAGPFSTDTYLAALPDLRADLEASDTAVQLSITACVLGLAIGLTLSGPISDARGRRPFLVAGSAGYLLTSLACALAPTITILDSCRLLQGLAAGAAAPMARAVISDHYTGQALTRRLATMTSIFLLAPVVAPATGGVIVTAAGWRGAFWFMVAVGIAMLALVLLGVPETLPVTRRQPTGPAALGARITGLLRARAYRSHLLVQCALTAALFTYVGSSPLIARTEYGVEPAPFALLFALNAAAMAAASVVFRLLIDRVDPQRMRNLALPISALATTALLISTLVGRPPLALTWGLLLVAIAGFGLALPGSIVLAQRAAGGSAGTASSLIAGSGYLSAALAAPLGGIAGADLTVMAALMTLWILAATAVALHTRRATATTPRVRHRASSI